MDKKIIQLQVILDSVKINKDSSATIKFETRELNGEEIAEIANFANKEAWMGLSELQIKKLDVPEETIEFKGDKSDSQRLREILWVYWNEKTDKKQTFEVFRKIQMEKFINLIKDKLD